MTAMDHCTARAGSFRLAVAASQLAGVAPSPPGLLWPPGPGGYMGLVPAGAGRAVAVLDALTCWQPSVPASESPSPVAASVPSRERPPYLLVLSGGALALAVDAYALGTHSVQPAPAVLTDRGVHALASLEDGYAVVLDMARLVASLNESPPLGRHDPPGGREEESAQATRPTANV